MRTEDEIFVNRCLQGDQAAFDFLVNKYKEVVHAYAYHKIGDYEEAQDIAQEVFIKAYSKLAQLKWPHKFQSWLYTIVSNECKMWHRSHSKERDQETPWENVPVEDLNELAVRAHSDKDIEHTVRSAMETLPGDNQLALSLYYMSSMSIKEIASFMGVSPNTVKGKLHRARRQLGERLENMLGKQLRKKKLKAGFIFRIVDSIRNMPTPSLPKPRPSKWMPIPIAIGMALLIGIIGFGVSSGKDVSSDTPILKPAKTTFEVSLLSDPDGQKLLESGKINDLVVADAGTSAQIKPAIGTASSGMVVRRVWENAEDAGRVSPDGRYVSHSDWNQGNLAIHDFETGENRYVTDEGKWGKEPKWANHAIWSPDSKQIAYVWFDADVPFEEPDSVQKADTSLRIVGIDGAKPRVLHSSPAGSGRLFPRAWSRDGKHILALHCKGGEKEETHEHGIVLVSVADGSIRVLKSLDGGRLRRPNSLSPDDRYVAHDFPQSEGSSKHDIFLLATDGGHEIPLVEHPANDYDPFWGPDGNRIVFVSDRSGSEGLWGLEVVDGKPKGSPRLISDNLDGMDALGVTRDGSYYYQLPGRTQDIYFADLDPETGKAVEPPTKVVLRVEGLNSQPAFSPDGKRLAYVSQRRPGEWWASEGESRSLVVRSLETGEDRELKPDPPLEHMFAPRWSPDGRSILVTGAVPNSVRESGWGFHQVHVETGAVTPVVWDDEDDIYADTPPVWSPDGNKIFFIRKGDGNNTSIKVYDLEAEREWSPDFRSKLGKDYRKHNLALSPDGQQLAFVGCLEDGHTIQIAPAVGGETREVLMKAGSTENAGLVWTPDGRYLLFGKWNAEEKGTELWRISVEGGKPQNLGLKIKKIEGLSIHPDGHRIAFTRPGATLGDEVWVMENILPGFTADK